MPRIALPKPKPDPPRIQCLLCETILPATGPRMKAYKMGKRVLCDPCEKRVRKARVWISSILGKPFRMMMSMARDIERRAAEMIDGPEIRLLAQLDTPAYRDIVADWQRITGQRVDPLPRQVLLPPAGAEQPARSPDAA